MTIISNNLVKIPETDVRYTATEKPLLVEKKDVSVDSFDAASFVSSRPLLSEHAEEEQFIRDLSMSDYGNIAKYFIDNYVNSEEKKFSSLENILISPTARELMPLRIKMAPYADKQLKLEEWHQEHAYKFAENLLEADEQTRVRHRKREEEGLGFGGQMSDINLKAKQVGQFTKNNLTIRGNLLKIGDALCGKSVYERVPLYAKRKGAKVGIKLSEMALNNILSLTGTGLAPVTLGISKIVTDQVSTVITLSGEAITGKALGATNKKIATNLGLRGVQLELPNILPGGSVIQLYEKVMGMGSNLSIAVGSIADIILRKTSSRYASMLTDTDLGDERVLSEMNQRIDYLAQFLIPYGQYLFLKTKNPENKKKLRYIITEQMKVLRDLERTKTKTLNFYLMAILAERIPPHRLAGIEEACRMVVPDTRKNSHQMVRRCLATLLRERPLVA